MTVFRYFRSSAQYGLRALITVMSILAIVTAFVVVPRIGETNRRRLFDEEGSLYGACLLLHDTLLLDRLTFFAGHVKGVTFSGETTRLQSQIDALPHFSKLEELYFSGISDDHKILTRIDLGKVRHLEFSDCGGKFIESVIANTPKFEILEIWDCHLLCDLHLHSLPMTVKRVRIDGSSVTGSFLRQESTLEELFLAYSPVSSIGILQIAKMSSLRKLDIRHPNVDSIGAGLEANPSEEFPTVSVAPLHCMRTLKELRLWGFNLSDPEVLNLSQSLPNTLVEAD